VFELFWKETSEEIVEAEQTAVDFPRASGAVRRVQNAQVGLEGQLPLRNHDLFGAELLRLLQQQGGGADPEEQQPAAEAVLGDGGAVPPARQPESNLVVDALPGRKDHGHALPDAARVLAGGAARGRREEEDRRDQDNQGGRGDLGRENGAEAPPQAEDHCVGAHERDAGQPARKLGSYSADEAGVARRETAPRPAPRKAQQHQV